VKATPTAIPDVLVLEPRLFSDARGWFYESFNERTFAELTGFAGRFVQDNHSLSVRGTLRGLHYQIQQAQGKLLRVVRGAIWDVAVDLRRGSPTFGRWVGMELSADNRLQAWIPPGFGHGFQVLSEQAEVVYKTTDFYAPAHERCLAWNDPTLAIAWPLAEPIVSDRDRQGRTLEQADLYE
jgi:dTDP-4-dehydrorhamnose 3,5-epimerase